MADQLRLLRDMAWNMSPQIATSLIGFATVSAQVYFLPQSHYGLWIAIRAVLETVSLVDLGIGWAITRRIARGEAAIEPPEPTMGANLFGLVLIGLIGVPVVQGFGLSTALELAGEADLGALVWPLTLSASAMYIAGQIGNYTHSVLFGLQRFDMRGTLSMGQTLATAAGTLGFAISGSGIEPIAIWHGVIALVFAGIGLVIVKGLARDALVPPSWREFRALPPITRFALSSQVTEIALTVIWDIGVLLIGFLAGPAAIVPFYVGTRVPRTLATILGSAAEILLPRGAAPHDTESARALIIGTTRWNLFKGLPVATALFVLGGAFLMVWLRRLEIESLEILRLTLAAVVFDTAGNATLYFLWGRGAMRRVATLATLRAAAAGLAMLVLVPSFGAAGAGWALLASMAAATMCLIAWIPGEEPWQKNADAIFRGFPAAVAISGGAAWSIDFLSGQWPLPDLIFGCFLGGLTFLIAFLVQGGPSAEQDLARQLAGRALEPVQALFARARR